MRGKAYLKPVVDSLDHTLFGGILGDIELEFENFAVAAVLDQRRLEIIEPVGGQLSAGSVPRVGRRAGV